MLSKDICHEEKGYNFCTFTIWKKIAAIFLLARLWKILRKAYKIERMYKKLGIEPIKQFSRRTHWRTYGTHLHVHCAPDFLIGDIKQFLNEGRIIFNDNHGESLDQSGYVVE